MFIFGCYKCLTGPLHWSDDQLPLDVRLLSMSLRKYLITDTIRSTSEIGWTFAAIKYWLCRPSVPRKRSAGIWSRIRTHYDIKMRVWVYSLLLARFLMFC